ncbi:glycosyltransferase [Candidatus Wolfebacteria bacterium]|nr:glycosyltransferase [Candidatus Wolfebacteria bacterium]
MKILFIGDLNEYCRSFQRYKTLIEMGHDIKAFSMTFVPQRPGIEKTPFFERLMWKLKLPFDITSVNEKIKEAVKKENYDIVWIEKGNTIWPRTLRFIKKTLPETRLISLSEDDMYAAHNRSLYYCWGLHYYDIVFTTKVYNLEELKKIGAKKTALFLDAYDETFHRPLLLSEEDRKKFGCDVGFIGTFEEDRAQKIIYLAQNGIKVTVWGNGWKKLIGENKNLIIKNKPLYGEDFVKAINATKINLCFLRKMNRDEVTSRSVEIPACGGFMLGERTKRHLDFFKEGVEAEFFDTNEELLDKVKKYLGDDEYCLRITEAGRERCVKNGYSMKIQLDKIIKIIVA